MQISKRLSAGWPIARPAQCLTAAGWRRHQIVFFSSEWVILATTGGEVVELSFTWELEAATVGGGIRDVCEREEERRELLTPPSRCSHVVWILNLKELLSGQWWHLSIRSPPYGTHVGNLHTWPPSICSVWFKQSTVWCNYFQCSVSWIFITAFPHWCHSSFKL